MDENSHPEALMQDAVLVVQSQIAPLPSGPPLRGESRHAHFDAFQRHRAFVFLLFHEYVLLSGPN